MTEWADRLASWVPPDDWIRMVSVDAHTEGEPLRVVVSGFPALRGRTVLERRREARRRHDGLRRTLMWEPRGHGDMYGCIVGPPVTGEADLSVLFTHNAGFSTMCGHGIIGVVTVLLETGMLSVDPTSQAARTDSGGAREAASGAAASSRSPSGAVGCPVGIDTPAGFVEARAELIDGRVRRVAFRNVPSFVARLDASVDVPGLGAVRYDLAYGGAFYAYVRADDFDLRLTPDETSRLVDLGSRIKTAVQATDPPQHPDDEDLGFLYGTVFVGAPHDPESHSRNVCVFADGEVDRCPTGTGVSGRLALHHARGEVVAGESIVVESILGTCFSGRIVETMVGGGLDAVVPEVTGRAWITGLNELLVAPDDPLAEGFLLR